MAEPTEEVKLCPECGQTIRKEATLCRFCGHAFEPRKSLVEPLAPAASASPRGAATDPAAARPKHSWLPLTIVAASVCVIALFAIRFVTSRGDPGARADAEFEDQMRHSFASAGWRADVAASNGVCTVTLPDEVPRGIAESVARMSAGVYSQLRRRHGSEPAVFVEVYVGASKLAEASSTTGSVDWRGELLKIVDLAREAEQQATSGR